MSMDIKLSRSELQAVAQRAWAVATDEDTFASVDRAIADAAAAKAAWAIVDWLVVHGPRGSYQALRDDLIAAGLSRPTAQRTEVQP